MYIYKHCLNKIPVLSLLAKVPCRYVKELQALKIYTVYST